MIERGQVFVGQYYRHIKNGELYTVVGRVKVKIDGLWFDAFVYSPAVVEDETDYLPEYVRTEFNFRERFEHVSD